MWQKLVKMAMIAMAQELLNQEKKKIFTPAPKVRKIPKTTGLNPPNRRISPPTTLLGTRTTPLPILVKKKRTLIRNPNNPV